MCVSLATLCCENGCHTRTTELSPAVSEISKTTDRFAAPHQPLVLRLLPAVHLHPLLAEVAAAAAAAVAAALQVCWTRFRVAR